MAFLVALIVCAHSRVTGLAKWIKRESVSVRAQARDECLYGDRAELGTGAPVQLADSVVHRQGVVV